MARMTRVRVVALVVAGAVGLAACTPGAAGPDRSTRPSVSASPSVAASSPVPALRLSDAPLWTVQFDAHGRSASPPPVPLAELAHLRLVGDALLIIGSVPGHGGTDRLVVSDARTGAPRWSVTRGDRVGTDGSRYDFLRSARVVGDPAGDWTLVTTFARPVGGSMAEIGIIGLSGRDGRLRWRIPVHRENRCSCPWTRSELMTLEPAAAGTVLVRIATDTVAEGHVAVRTVAYDVATRRPAWTVTGVEPQAVEGGLVLVQRPRLPVKLTDSAPASLVALDLRTGAVRWDLAGGYPDSTLVFAGGDTLVVDRGDGTLLVDTATGAVLGTSPARLAGCARTAEVFVCRDTGGQVSAAKVATVLRSGPAASVTPVPDSQWCWRVRVWQALLYCDDSTAQLGRTGAIDVAGRVAANGLPGRLETVDGSVAVFSTGAPDRDAGTVAVYAVTA
jgi:hypothetical protein